MSTIRFRSGVTMDLDYLLAIVEDNMFGLGNTGICMECGAEQDGCEPDARNYPCEACGERAVFGAEEILLMVVV